MATQSTDTRNTQMQPYEPNTNQALTLPMEITSLADAFVKSGFFADTKQQAQAIVKILYGQELGIGPVASMLNVHVIEGKPALGSNLMAAIIKRSGRYDFTVDRHTTTECVLTFYTGQRKLGQSTFTIDDAKRAGVAGRQNWTRYPKAMLFARALSMGARMYCADIFLGAIYEPEELREVEHRSTPTVTPKMIDDGEVIDGEVIDDSDFLAEAVPIPDPDEGPLPDAPTQLTSEEMYARYRAAKKIAVKAHLEQDFADAVREQALKRDDNTIVPFEGSPLQVQYAIMLAAEAIARDVS